MADYIDAFSDTGPPVRLLPCSCCGRSFNADTLPRHEKICSKLKTRKPFDSSKQRTEGLSQELPKSKSSPAPPKPKKSNWKQKHEEFQATVKAARYVTVAVKKGEPLPPPPPPAANPDYVQCPHCARRFHEHSAERHIGFCKEQKSRIAKSGASSTAANRMAIRTQYKPPLPGKRTSSGSSPSYASKTRQTSSKPSPTTSEYKPANYDDHPLPTSTKTTGGTSKMSPAASPGSRRRAASVGKATDTSRTANMARTGGQGSSSAGSRTRYASDDSNGLTGHYTNKHRSKDNYLESMDSDEEQPIRSKAEVKYGRRASSKSRDSPTDYTGHEDIAERVSSGSSRSGSGRRHINVRDPSPTLFDDFGLSDNSPDKNPFTARAKVHRPSSNEPRSQANDVTRGKKLSKFCYECGTKYPVANAKFCCECGMKRLHVEL